MQAAHIDPATVTIHSLKFMSEINVQKCRIKVKLSLIFLNKWHWGRDFHENGCSSEVGRVRSMESD